MKTVAVACLAAGACLFTVSAETPLEVIAARDAAFADLYNKGDYAGVTAVYHPDADLVPDTVDEFLTHDKLENFFEDSARQGLASLKLEPLNVVVESDTLWHEIGNVSHSLNPAGNLYYVRWVKPNSTWLIAFDMMAIGEGFKQSVQPPKASHRQQRGVAKGNDGQVIAALEGLWTALYDAGDYAGVADMYNPGAQLIPANHSTDFLTQDKFAEFFQQQTFGEKAVRKPTLTHQEDDTLIHEIGQMDTAEGQTAYYIRWVKPATSWQIAFDIMSVGGP
eukprot:INCI6083.1.p1 GENE.INCI6083.1~~INCI6083.1.p1  ORF type:complete len:278 (-),score=64.45 INCI6083.1:398-1231(-)